jgi:hypothetical protein
MRKVPYGVTAVLLATAMSLAFTAAPQSAGAAASRAGVFVGAWTPISTPSLGSDSNFILGDSCASGSFCVGVGSIGYYGDSSSAPLIEQWNGSTWTIANVQVPQSLSGAAFTGVSCPTPAFCEAVGYGHNGPHGFDSTFIAQWNGTAWTVQASPNFGISGDNDLASVSCANSMSCVAVGTNYGTSPDYVNTGIIENWTGSGWVLTSAPVPPGATSSQLSGVSCSAGNCTAVGNWDSGTLVDLYSGNIWSVVPSPNAAGWSNDLVSVSCTGISACTAVGSYSDPVNGTVPLVEVWNGTAWSVTPIFDPNPYGGYLNAVDCLGPNFCQAVGGFFLNANQNSTQNAAFSSQGSTWSASPSAEPAGTPKTTNGDLDGVSCVHSPATLRASSNRRASVPTATASSLLTAESSPSVPGTTAPWAASR